MAKKKKSEEIQETVLEPVEVVEASPEVETPKKTTKKSAKKKVEEPVVEEVKEEPALDAEKVEAYFEKLDTESVEAPIVVEDATVVEVPAEVVAEEKPKKVKKVKKTEAPAPVKEVKIEASADEFPYTAVVTAKVAANIMKEPSVFCTKVGSLNKGARVKILEVCGNFGKIGNGKWININYIEKI